jgi:hypothetical protein
MRSLESTTLRIQRSVRRQNRSPLQHGRPRWIVGAQSLQTGAGRNISFPYSSCFLPRCCLTWIPSGPHSSTVISSDEEGHRIIDDSDDSIAGPTNRNGKRPKVRAKSRSPTPPPALPDHLRNEARRIARKVVREQDPISMIDLDGPRRTQQPVLNIESSEEDDPDFAAIAAKVRAEHKRKVPQPLSTQTNGAGSSASSSVVKVKVLVKWVPHPFDEFANEQPEERWEYFIDRVCMHFCEPPLL